MNYDYIEKFAAQARLGDAKAKELLAVEFTPFISNLSKKTFINSYEASDIKGECYKTLFKCVNEYNSDRHRFVAYATSAIKNSVNHLIRVSVRRSSAEGKGAFILDGGLESTIVIDMKDIGDIVLENGYKAKLKAAMKTLDTYELEMIQQIYFLGNSIKKYAEVKGISYYDAISRKSRILKKLKAGLESSLKSDYLN